METLTTKKSRPTRNAAARTTASDFHRPGSGLSATGAAAGGVEADGFFIGDLLKVGPRRLRYILHCAAVTLTRKVHPVTLSQLSRILLVFGGFLTMVLSASPADRAKVILLGTGTPIPDPTSSGPSVAIVVNGQAYLFDAGAGE